MLPVTPLLLGFAITVGSIILAGIHALNPWFDVPFLITIYENLYIIIPAGITLMAYNFKKNGLHLFALFIILVGALRFGIGLGL